MARVEGRQDWERFGSEGPYYGSITLPRFRGNNLAPEKVADFFASGEKQIAGVLELIRARWNPLFAPSRALDFGCGVGRCSLALASICEEVVGVDVSEAMLEAARAVSSTQALTNTRFVRSDESLSQVTGQFDLIHSSFTFQHIPPRQGMDILRRLIELLSDSGIAALDFLVARDVPKMMVMLGNLRKRIPLVHNFANLLERKPFREPYMEKNIYDLNQIVTLLHECGCGEVHMQIFRNHRNRDALIYFQKGPRNRISHELFMSKWVPEVP